MKSKFVQHFLSFFLFFYFCHRSAIVFLQSALYSFASFLLLPLPSLNPALYRAEAQYGAALDLQPGLEAARLRRHAVRCQVNLQRALARRHEKLQETLRELRNYKRQQETWTSMLAMIISEQATIEAKSVRSTAT